MGFSKVIIFSAFLIFWGILGLAHPAAAQSLNNYLFDFTLHSDIDLLKGLNPLNTVIPAGLHPEPTIAVLLCDIRRYMCGDLGIVLITTTVFITGILILTQKITWPTAILTVVLITIFVYASELADLLLESGIFGDFYDAIADWSCQCL